MTWGEFIAAVEAKGVTKDTEIEYIDLHPFDADSIEVKDIDAKGDTGASGRPHRFAITSYP